MGLQQNVWHADPVAQGGFFPSMTRILIAADMEPRPTMPSRSLTEHQSSPVPGCIAIH